jgi:PEP-CTERM putative exosortase interaction domain
MHKQLLLSVLILTSVFLSNAPKASYIVDTGSNSAGINYLFYSGQYFAGRFSINSSQTINSIEGFFSNELGSAGSVAIKLYSDLGNGSNIPATELFSTTINLADLASLDWYGASGLGWSIQSGTYWAAFEPSLDIFGIFRGGAPNPLTGYAAYYNDNWHSGNFGVGIRIDATAQSSNVPEPTAIFLLGFGILVAFANRHKLSAF